MCPSLVRVLWASNLTRLSSPSSQTNSSSLPAVPTPHFPLLLFFLLLMGYCFNSFSQPQNQSGESPAHDTQYQGFLKCSTNQAKRQNPGLLHQQCFPMVVRVPPKIMAITHLANFAAPAKLPAQLLAYCSS